MGFFGLLARAALPFVGRAAMGILQKVAPALGQRVMSFASSPLGTAMRSIGSTASQWIHKPLFDAAMGRVGGMLQDRLDRSHLQPVFDG